MNVILIGMPASGKSTIGVVLAKHLVAEFVDTDLLIQEYQGKSLQEIMDLNGPDRLKELEQEVILNRISFRQKTVVATGGSAVYSDKTMDFLHSSCCIIYLQISFEVLTARLKDFSQRGIVRTKNQSLYDLYLERKSLYEKWADITIPNMEDVDSAVRQITESMLLYTQ